jgi:hypothetical protein
MSYLLANIAESFLKGSEHTRSVAESWDLIWEQFFDFVGGDLSTGELLFAQMCYLGFVAATGSLIFLAIHNLKLWHEGNYFEYFLNMFYPIIIAILLSNNGILLASFCFEMRGVFNEISDKLLELTVAGVNLNQIFQELQQALATKLVIADYVGHCEALLGQDQLDCIDSAITQIQAEIDQVPQSTIFLNQVSDFLSNLVQEIREVPNRNENIIDGLATPTNMLKEGISVVLSPLWQNIVFSILSDLMQAYQIALEISLFMATLVAPLAVGGSLLPMGTRPVIPWAIGFASVGLAKLLFNLVAGLAAASAVGNFETYVAGDSMSLYWISDCLPPLSPVV